MSTLSKAPFWIRESVASAPGVGDISLGGAYGNAAPVSDAYSNGEAVSFIVVDGPNREFCRGTYTVATNSLSRDTVVWALVGNTLTSEPGTKISFTADAVVTVWPDLEALDVADVNFNGSIEIDALSTIARSVDSKTDGAVAMPFFSRLYMGDANYLRNLIGQNGSKDIEVGQSGTTYIRHVNLIPGSGGEAQVAGQKILDETDYSTDATASKLVMRDASGDVRVVDAFVSGWLRLEGQDYPRVFWDSDLAAADEGKWAMIGSASSIDLRSYSDDFQTWAKAFAMFRTGSNIQSIRFYNGADAEAARIDNGKLLVGRTTDDGSGDSVQVAGNIYGNQLKSNSGQVLTQGAAPYVRWYQSDGATDEKRWEWLVDSNSFSVRLSNDAYSDFNSAYQIYRTGQNIASHRWYTGDAAEAARMQDGKMFIGRTSDDGTGAALQVTGDASFDNVAGPIVHEDGLVSRFGVAYAPAAYLVPGEYLEVFTLTPSASSANYNFTGEIVATAGNQSVVVPFRVVVRSNTLPSLSYDFHYDKRYVGTSYSVDVEPVIWWDSTNGVIKLAIKGIAGSTQNVGVTFDAHFRTLSTVSDLAVNDFGSVVELGAIPSGFSESFRTATITETHDSKVLIGNDTDDSTGALLQVQGNVSVKHNQPEVRLYDLDASASHRMVATGNALLLQAPVDGEVDFTGWAGGNLAALKAAFNGETLDVLTAHNFKGLTRDSSISEYSGDLNACTDTGIYHFSSADVNMANLPSEFTGGWAFMQVYRRNDWWTTQVVYGMNSADSKYRQWMRHQENTVWTEWKLVVDGTFAERFDERLDGFTTTGRLESYTGNLNSILWNSTYDTSSSVATNFPSEVPGGCAATVETLIYSGDTNWGYQTFTVYSGTAVGQRWWRQRASGAWQTWKLSQDMRYDFDDRLDGFDGGTRRHVQFTGNIDDIVNNSRYSIKEADCSGGTFPSSSHNSLGWDWLETMVWSGGGTWAIQRLYGMNSTQLGFVWQRVKNAGTWGSWNIIQNGAYDWFTHNVYIQRPGATNFLDLVESSSGSANKMTFRASSAGTQIYWLGAPAGTINWNHQLYYDFTVNQFRYSSTADGATADDLQLPNMGMVREAIAAESSSFAAWVNFQGTGTVAIIDSLNVSSVTDNGTGSYTVNFTTALANANYGVLTGGWLSGAKLAMVGTGSTKTTTALGVGSFQYNSGTSNDLDQVTVAAVL